MTTEQPARQADLTGLGLFDGLSEAQLAELAAAGTVVAFDSGEELFTEGAPAEHWWVLLGGGLELSRHVGREDTVVARMPFSRRQVSAASISRSRTVRAPARGWVSGLALTVNILAEPATGPEQMWQRASRQILCSVHR